MPQPNMVNSGTIASPRLTRSRAPRRGFTLLEMLAVLAIISIMALIAYPKVNFTQFDVDAGARVVRITLQNAQRLAVTRQYDVVVSFDLTANRMRVLEDKNNNGSVDDGERVTWHPLEDGVQFAVPPVALDGSAATQPVSGSNIKPVDGMPSITFRRDGAASTDADVYLTSKRARSDDFRGVSVVQATGRTAWARYLSTNTWKIASI